MGDGGGEGDDESEWEEEGQGPDWVVREMVDWWVGA